MPSLKSEEKKIYQQLLPFFALRGYEPYPTLKQFRLQTPTGFRCAQLAIRNEQPALLLQLGVRFNLLESLVQQFIQPNEPLNTDATSLMLPVEQKYPEFDLMLEVQKEHFLPHALSNIQQFMRVKGFRILQAMDNVRRADALLNRSPKKPSPYLPHTVQRCFRGLVLARLTHRTRFGKLQSTYESYLSRMPGAEELIQRFRALATFLQVFSFN